MLSALIRSERSYSAMHLAAQPINQRFVQHGPLVLVSDLLKSQRPQQIETELSHDVLNPARVPL